MAQTPQFSQAPHTYNMEMENMFRRELANILLLAMAIGDNVATGQASVSSLTHKRHQYLPSVGVAART